MTGLNCVHKHVAHVNVFTQHLSVQTMHTAKFHSTAHHCQNAARWTIKIFQFMRFFCQTFTSLSSW